VRFRAPLDGVPLDAIADLENPDYERHQSNN
jgi:hypothetical protein